MGEKILYQPLTREDKVTVVLYRIGIVLSALTIVIGAVIALNGTVEKAPLVSNLLLISLSFSNGLSVFFIHLYVIRFHRFLKKLYYLAVISLIVLFVMGRGDALAAASRLPLGPFLLMPLSLCLGFITAKEAFCFRLMEGYLLAMIMPLYLLLIAAGAFTEKGIAYGLALIAALFVLFTSRKVFQPIHFDIGDKSAYM